MINTQPDPCRSVWDKFHEHVTKSSVTPDPIVLPPFPQYIPMASWRIT